MNELKKDSSKRSDVKVAEEMLQYTQAPLNYQLTHTLLHTCKRSEGAIRLLLFCRVDALMLGIGTVWDSIC